MRIVSWNILQGGGRRSRQLIETLSELDPDVVALQEFRHGRTKPILLAGLGEIGLHNHVLPEPSAETSNVKSVRSLNCVGLVSHYPVEGQVLVPSGQTSVKAALALNCRVSIIDAETPDINIIVVHLPHKQKQPPYFESLLNLPSELRQKDTLIIGDFNCGIPFEDSQTKTFPATHQFQALLAQGWVDAWRSRNAGVQEFSWISTRKGNGYRYDHALASPTLNNRISSIRYSHEPRKLGISDHSLLIVDID